MKFCQLLAIASLALSSVTGTAQAATLNFNGTAGEYSSSTYESQLAALRIFQPGETYTEGGFIMTALSSTVAIVDNSWPVPGFGIFDDDLLDVDRGGAVVFETETKGGTFDAIGMYAAQAGADYQGSVRLTGLFESGGSISYTAQGCGTGCLQYNSFAGFENLQSLRIDFLEPFMGLDDIELVARDSISQEPVPVPATLALLGLGLISLGWTRRKHRALSH